MYNGCVGELWNFMWQNLDMEIENEQLFAFLMYPMETF